MGPAIGGAVKNVKDLVIAGSLAFGLMLPGSPVFAQTQGGGGGGGTGGGSGRGTSVPSPGTVGKQPYPGSIPRQPDYTTVPPVQRGWFLSGKVMMDDGTAPPDTVQVEQVCSGNRKPVAYTDSKGRFSYEVGQQHGIIPDASIGSADVGLGPGTGMDTSGDPRFGGYGAPGSSISSQLLMGCELRASLPGYSSDSVNLTGRHYMDSPDVGTIILHRLAGVEGTSISVTSLDAPKDAKKAYEKGRDSLKKQKWSQALTHLEKAVSIYPKYAAAWFGLGVCQQRQGNAKSARESYSKALSADPKYLQPYLPLAAMALDEKNWRQAADLSGKLVRLDPIDYPSAFLLNAIANVNLQEFQAAEESARKAVSMDPQHRIPRAEYVLGLILANKRDYDDALPLLRSYLQHDPQAPDAETVKKQIIQIESVAKVQPAPAPPSAQQ
jgi:Flp pilus assembly protein TadD